MRRLFLSLVIVLLVCGLAWGSGLKFNGQTASKINGVTVSKWSKAYSFDLRDDFLVPYAAGSVNGTAPYPGPSLGNRVVIDTANKLSISGNLLQILPKASPSWADPALYEAGEARVLGKTGIFKFRPTYNDKYCNIGFNNNQTGLVLWPGISLRPDGTLLAMNNGGVDATIGSYSADTDYILFVPLRGDGSYTLIQGGAYTYPTFVRLNANTGSASPLYPCITNYDGTISVATIRVPPLRWIPVPEVSDSFTGTFPATDGLGHLDNTGIGAGGVTTWTVQAGGFSNSGGNIVATSLTGGVAIATAPMSSRYTNINVTAVTKNTTGAGMVLHYVNSLNYHYVWFDGTNWYLVEMLAGTPSTLLTSAGAGSDDIWLQVESATTIRLIQNVASVGVATVDASINAANCGPLAFDTDSTIGKMSGYARGNEKQYNFLMDHVQ